MCQVLIVLVSVCALASGSSPGVNDRIIGGAESSIQMLPWQVSMKLQGITFCGGSIISESTVLTVAHCLNNKDPATFTFHVGSSTSSSGGYVHEVSNIITHPKYNSNNDYNIAIIWVSEPFHLGQPGVQAIGLADVEPSADIECIATGWETIVSGVVLKIVSRDFCSILYPGSSITPRMICAGSMSLGTEDTCQYSGGPLICQEKLAGIVSWGELCAAPLTSYVYTNVANLYTWVRQNGGLQ